MNTKATILFVDDEERIVNLLKMMFRSNYEVLTATSGKQALEIVQSRNVHVIVSDQRMPEMLGTELLSSTRKVSPETMRILLTGYSDLAAIVGSVNDSEIFRFVNKPWNNDEMKFIVGEAARIAMTIAEPTMSQLNPFLPDEMGVIPALLVVDDNASDRQQIMDLFSNDHHVHGASTVAEALSMLEAHDIGVIVSEARIGNEDTGQLLHVLKRHHPMITTVMLTNSADSDLVIKMINQAQIFRFAMKPIRSGVLQLAVAAAMKEHKRFRSNPRLLARVSVTKSSEPISDSLVAVVSAGLSRLRSRFAFFSGKSA